MSTEERFDHDSLQFTTGSPEDFEALYHELSGTPGLWVKAVPAIEQPGEQGGTVELVTVALSEGGAIAALLKLVTDLVEARGPKFVLKVRRGKNRLEIKSDNIDEVLPALEELAREP